MGGVITARSAENMPYIHELPQWLTGLLQRRILVKDEGGGRSTSYSLADVA
jgi:hypothetical protein